MFDRNMTSEDAINVIVDALTTENMEPKVAKHLLNKLVETVVNQTKAALE